MSWETFYNSNKISEWALSNEQTSCVFQTPGLGQWRPVHTYCSQTLLLYLFIRFARISYGQFIAICYKFKRSTYNQEPLVIVGVKYRERFQTRNS
jgi:hypothetical protein